MLPNEVEQVAVEHVVMLRVDKCLGWYNIANEMNADERFRKLARNGEKWNAKCVRKIGERASV